MCLSAESNVYYNWKPVLDDIQHSYPELKI